MNKNSIRAVIATNRFGLGAKPGEIAITKSDPEGWLLSQFKSPSLTPGLTNSNEALRQIAEYSKRRRAAREEKSDADGMMADVREIHPRNIFKDLSEDGIKQAIESDASFNFRLLDFFSNHFSVSTSNPQMTGLAATLEREAIAPHLFGRFEDMLVAVTSHPAMLAYLNNEQSFGPNSKIAQRRKEKGLNENLAREILELHTLGVNGGYTQDDVLELAKALTGWSIARPNGNDRGEGFFFRSFGHEPGTRKVLKQKYSESGVRQAEAILRDLAIHPSTARFLSTKIARHFVSDNPPEKLISRLEKTWLKSDGNLSEVFRTLIQSDESWQKELQKFKTPREFLISTLRATGERKTSSRFYIPVLLELGQRPFNAGSPAGYSDYAKDWNGADAIYRRVEVAARFAKQYRSKDAIQLARNSLGEMLHPNTEQHLKRAESFQQAFTLWLMSPEFQRR